MNKVVLNVNSDTGKRAKMEGHSTNTSFVVFDPKGEIVRDTGKFLQKKGYEVRKIDLINMERNHCYNPFVYLKDDNDLQRLIAICEKIERKNKNE